MYGILLEAGLIPVEEYTSYLDELFIHDESNDLLLDLEFCSSNPEKMVQTIYSYCGHLTDFNYRLFGKLLFERLEYAYNNGGLELNDFGITMYRLWDSLPDSIQNEEPFRTLSYADDPLSYGDEKQSRLLYQEAFRFYEKNFKNQKT